MIPVLILYIPVIHRGYIDLLKSYRGKVSKLYILDEEIVNTITKYKEIRAVNSQIIRKMIIGAGLEFDIQVLTLKKIEKLKPTSVICVSDTISKKVIKKYFPKVEVSYEKIFLKWDEKTVKSSRPPIFNRESFSGFDKAMMKKAIKMGNLSSDWWRQVGVVVVKKGKVIIKAYNEYLPSEHTPYIEGNPRDYIKAGTLGFLATSVHAEQSAISKASRLGISLRGADMYLNSYPCPTCAKLMGMAGIRRCFFSGGNAYLNVDEVFKTIGIETVLVREED